MALLGHGRRGSHLHHPMSGRVHAYVWHDGYGKYHPTIIVSLWRALRLLRQREGLVVSLLPFPRIAIECYRLRSDTIQLSQDYVEELLGPLHTARAAGPAHAAIKMIREAIEDQYPGMAEGLYAAFREIQSRLSGKWQPPSESLNQSRSFCL